MQNNDIDSISNSVKIIIPAIIGVGIKVAVEMKKNNNKVSWVNILISMFIGVGSVWVSKDVIQDNFSHNIVPLVIAILAIIADKIAEFLIDKLKVDSFITAIINILIDYLIINFRNKTK